jgi:hypothetical protein
LQRRFLQRCVMAALVLALGACASPERHWPQFEGEETLVLAAGRFSDVRLLDDPPCFMNTEDYLTVDGLNVDCFSGPPATSRFHVIDVLYGTLPEKTVTVLFHSVLGRPYQPPGEGRPVLAALISDGRHHAALRTRLEVARTTSGEWAVPVEDDDVETDLPCGAEPLARPLQFASPRPGRTLDAFGMRMIEDLRQNPRVELRGKRLYVTHGITFGELRDFVARLPLTSENFYCR